MASNILTEFREEYDLGDYSVTVTGEDIIYHFPEFRVDVPLNFFQNSMERYDVPQHGEFKDVIIKKKDKFGNYYQFVIHHGTPARWVFDFIGKGHGIGQIP